MEMGLGRWWGVKQRIHESGICVFESDIFLDGVRGGYFRKGVLKRGF